MTPEPVRHPRLSLVWKITVISIGSALVLVGIVGLFLPILQGWLMIFAGLAMLSPHSRHARRILNWLKDTLHIHRHKGAGGPPASKLVTVEPETEEKRTARM